MNGVLNHREGFGVLAVDSILLRLLAAFLLSQAIAWVYLGTHRGISYSGTMARALVALALIVTLVMMVIGNNIARAFGLFGALALIRFRTPVKDVNDTVFLFLAVAIGIAAGTGNILTGGLGTLVIGLVIYYLAAIRFGDKLNHDGLLRFRLPVGGSQENAINKVLQHYCDAFHLLHIREAEHGSTVELSYQIKIIDTSYSSQLVAEIQGFSEVSHLSLLLQDAEATP